MTPHPIQPDLLDHLLAAHAREAAPAYERLWRYYRNAAPGASGAAGVSGGTAPAQAEGLPARLREPAAGGRPRELVVENDIAWRVHTLVDFMFGRPLALQSTAADPGRAALLERFLRAVLERNGGVALLQDVGLLGSVHGHVDVVVHVDERAGGGGAAAGDDPAALAERVALEVVEAPRGVPLLSPHDYRRLDGYVVDCVEAVHAVVRPDLLTRLRRRLGDGGVGAGRRAVCRRTRVWTAGAWAEYVSDGAGLGSPRRLVASGENRLGRVPVVHIQNLPQPFFYSGLGEVEPLIPLQDELNTRLSDRANRITFQSFKMYLGKGIDGFLERPVGPGQMWSTDNAEAEIQEFGGDAACPSESAHIAELREAMDKASGVTPLAAGVLRDRIGNLTSENALQVTLLGLLAKTEKKRLTYGGGLRRLCELVLHAADAWGLLPSEPAERGVRLDWPDPLPTTAGQRLRDGRLKLELGVPRRRVLAELGYADCVE